MTTWAITSVDGNPFRAKLALDDEHCPHSPLLDLDPLTVRHLLANLGALREAQLAVLCPPAMGTTPSLSDAAVNTIESGLGTPAERHPVEAVASRPADEQTERRRPRPRPRPTPHISSIEDSQLLLPAPDTGNALDAAPDGLDDVAPDVVEFDTDEPETTFVADTPLQRVRRLRAWALTHRASATVAGLLLLVFVVVVTKGALDTSY